LVFVYILSLSLSFSLSLSLSLWFMMDVQSLNHHNIFWVTRTTDKSSFSNFSSSLIKKYWRDRIRRSASEASFVYTRIWLIINPELDYVNNFWIDDWIYFDSRIRFVKCCRSSDKPPSPDLISDTNVKTTIITLKSAKKSSKYLVELLFYYL